MAISQAIQESIAKSSWIRKMFEEGLLLKEKFGADNVFDFTLGNPDVQPPEEFFDNIIKIIQDRHPGGHGYMPNAGYPHVKQAIADKVSEQHSIDITQKSIVMTCGAAGGLNTVFKTILDPDDEVIVPIPYFAEYNFYITNHRGKMVPVQTNDDFSLNITHIKNAVTEKTKAVLINSPNNPSGKVYSKNEIITLCSLLREKRDEGQDIYLLADEPYREIVYDGITLPSILKEYDLSIVVTSYSKTLSIPGERIGYIAVNPACDEFDLLMSGLIISNRILGFVNAPALMQRVVAGLTSVRVDIDTYKQRRDMLMQGLDEAGYTYIKPEGAFYIFCKTPDQDDVAFVQHLQKYNILTVPGSGFGAPGYFRIAYCINEQFIQNSLTRFKKALADYH